MLRCGFTINVCVDAVSVGVWMDFMSVWGGDDGLRRVCASTV